MSCFLLLVATALLPHACCVLIAADVPLLSTSTDSSTDSPLICFTSTSAGNRGVQVSLYDYMHYTETLLGYRTLLLLPFSVFDEQQRSPTTSSLSKFAQRFHIVVYSSDSGGGASAVEGAEPGLSAAVLSHNCQVRCMHDISNTLTHLSHISVYLFLTDGCL
jgi:hypothetical protein